MNGNRKILAGGVRVLSVFAAALVLALSAPAGGAEKDPERVLAKVEAHEIKEKDVDEVIASIGPQGAMYDSEQGRNAILNELVSARLFALSAVKDGLDRTDAYARALENFRLQTLARLAIDKVMEDIAASEDETKKFYDENPEQFTTPEEIRVRHILVSDDVASADKIALVRDELGKGVSFDVLATEHSICPSAPQGGDLGFFSRGQMVPEFEEKAFALKTPGEVSDPVKSSFGWHIIKLEERKEPSVAPYDGVKQQIAQYLTNEARGRKYQELLDGLKKEYKVEMFDVSGDIVPPAQ
ncbi:MAG: peptidylprolyl isomerase [Synergistaceae bacterium]|jgi:peptidyl-prolyl cis-trans isomerase C|nr:peptidylprolyl isomerase [Synergistaceae bacterium]